jgi:hypothetical protein
MGIEMGRISGGALADNLLRNGVDLAFETQLLYFDVTNQRVGINTNGPVADLNSPNNLRSVNFKTTTTSTFPNYTISGNTIQNTIGTIYLQPNQASNPQILTSRVGTANLYVSNQLIQNYINNSDINLSPVAGGQTTFTTTQVNIQGNGTTNGDLHATGDITWDGNITLGNDLANDKINFAAEISSDILPSASVTDNLGSSSLNWSTLYSVNVNAANNIDTTNLTVNGINLFFSPSNTIYVSVNGSDTNSGTHLHSTYLTLTKALSVATSGTEIIIFPGTYTEPFPLIIPQGVTVKGTSIRSTIIQPTAGTQSNDAFLLNGDTTVEFLTIQNFYYNSSANTGYAFRFANSFHTDYRSPYIANITVITKGSITSVSDPRGFNQGDAGRGLLLDGSVALLTSSSIPTMLCYSVTLITPNADAIIATNGVRLEWLNGFTYFAKIGLHLLNGTAGRYNQGAVFGAEVRSINSANIYGTYGVIADGANTLAYLVGHNFGYIGADGDFNNDKSKAIQDHEVQQLNSGVVYWESTDQAGNFRIGNIFNVNQTTGEINVVSQTIDVTSGGSIVLQSGLNVTIINAVEIATGNIVISGNTIQSIPGDINFISATNDLEFKSNTTISGLTAVVTQDSSLLGNTTFGSSFANTLTFSASIPQTFLPNANGTLYLGSSNYRWATLYNYLTDIGGVTQISNNTITTLTTDTDLKLQANGSGNIHIYKNVQVNNNLTTTNNLTINGISTLADTTITGITTLTGNFNQIGSSNSYITGTLYGNNTQLLSSGSYVQTPNITLQYNNISTTNTNGDLNLTPNGTGSVNVEYVKFYGNNISNNWPSPNYVVIDSSSLNTVTNNGMTFSNNTPGTNTNYGSLNSDATGTQTLSVASSAILTVYNQANFTVESWIYLLGFSATDNTIIGDISGATAKWRLIIVGNKLRFTWNDDALNRGVTAGASIASGVWTHVAVSVSANSIKLFVNGGLQTLTDLYAGDTNNLVLYPPTSSTGTIQIGGWNTAAYAFYGYLTGLRIVNGTGIYYTGFTPSTLPSVVANTSLLLLTASALSNTQKSIIITPTGSNNTIVNTTTSLVLPQGSDTNRILSLPGEIRYNNINNNFEGYDSTGYVNFINLYSQNYQTYITPESTPGANDSTIRLATNGTVKATITNSAFKATTWNAGSVAMSGNTINPIGSTNLNVVPVSVTTTYSGSVEFTGSNYLSIDSGTNVLSLGTGSFTAECWVFYTSIPTTGECIFGIWDTTHGLEYMLTAVGGNQLEWFARNSTATSNNPIPFACPSINAWHHIAISRVLTTTTVYVDGVSVGSATFNGTQHNGTGAPFTIGARDSGTGLTHFVGYITNLRILPGISLYQSNFPPLTAPLSPIIGTQLLLRMSTSALELTDSGPNNFTITNIGSVAWSTYTPFPYSTITTGGNTIVNSIGFNGNYITNPSNSPFVLSATGNGYVKFGSPTALVVPFGTSAERPTTVEIGMTRYNSELNYLEVWDGSNWVSSVGTTGYASQTQVEDLSFVYSLIFGGHGG